MPPMTAKTKEVIIYIKWSVLLSTRLRARGYLRIFQDLLVNRTTK